MPEYNDNKSINYSEIKTLVNNFTNWIKKEFPQDLYLVNLSIKTIQQNSNIYNVLADRVLLLSGLLDVNDSEFIQNVNNHLTFIIESYKIAKFRPLTIDTNLFHAIIINIEKSLNTTNTFYQIDKLNQYYTYIKTIPAFQRDVQTFQRKVQNEFPLIFDNFDVVFNSLQGELLELVNNITTIVLTNNNDKNKLTIIQYLQKYNRIMAKYQLLQPYQDGASRITILQRIVHIASNTIGRIDGGKKTKKRRKNSRKKKGSKKTKKNKKRRTIKKNRKK